MRPDRDQSAQDAFLGYLRDTKAEVTMFLVTGVRLQGYISGFDSYTVLLKRGDSSQAVYKHAISAINPAVPVPIPQQEDPVKVTIRSRNVPSD